MRKWIKDESGLFITNCNVCGSERRTKKRPYDQKGCNKCSVRNKEWLATYDYSNEQRSRKISEGKKIWWSKQNKKELMDTWLGDYVGSDKHIKMCKSNQIKATKASVRCKVSKPEREFAKKLKKQNIEFIQQYYVESFPFDFFIPSKNLLIEIDGEFYHPLNEEDCVYDIQKHNYKRDKRKNRVAKKHGYKLERIRV